MTVVWIAVAIVGGCLMGVLGMCLLIISHNSDEQATHMPKDVAHLKNA